MATTVDPLHMRRVLGKNEWGVPQPFGEDGWGIVRLDGTFSVFVTEAEWDGVSYIHASIAGMRDNMPTYDHLVALHRAVFRGGYAYQVFAPPDKHVNIHANALHLWGRADGKPALPEFATYGSI